MLPTHTPSHKTQLQTIECHMKQNWKENTISGALFAAAAVQISQGPTNAAKHLISLIPREEKRRREPEQLARFVFTSTEQVLSSLPISNFPWPRESFLAPLSHLTTAHRPKLAQKPRFSDFWRRKGLFCSPLPRRMRKGEGRGGGGSQASSFGHDCTFVKLSLRILTARIF